MSINYYTEKWAAYFIADASASLRSNQLLITLQPVNGYTHTHTHTSPEGRVGGSYCPLQVHVGRFYFPESMCVCTRLAKLQGVMCFSPQTQCNVESEPPLPPNTHQPPLHTHTPRRSGWAGTWWMTSSVQGQTAMNYKLLQSNETRTPHHHTHRSTERLSVTAACILAVQNTIWDKNECVPNHSMPIVSSKISVVYSLCKTNECYTFTSAVS